MDGWIKIFRRVIEHPDYFAEPFTRMSAWIDLLLMANYANGYIRSRGVRVEVKVGQIVTSTVSLAQRWKWSRGKVQRYLDELENAQQIEQQKSNLCTLISICNYDKYQVGDTADCTASYTADETADSTRTDTSKEEYKKNKNNINTHTVDTVRGVVGGNFSSEAEELIVWIESQHPALARKQRPLTAQQAQWLLKKHDTRTLRRIISEMADNPKTSEKEDVYCRIVTFLRWDRKQEENPTKRYSYEEVCDEVTRRGLKWDTFTPIHNDRGDVQYWLKNETRFS